MRRSHDVITPLSKCSVEYSLVQKLQQSLEKCPRIFVDNKVARFLWFTVYCTEVTRCWSGYIVLQVTRLLTGIIQCVPAVANADKVVVVSYLALVLIVIVCVYSCRELLIVVWSKVMLYEMFYTLKITWIQNWHVSRYSRVCHAERCEILL